MEVDILNYSPTVMFRGTPCTKHEILLQIFIINLFYYYFIIFYGPFSWGRIKKI